MSCQPLELESVSPLFQRRALALPPALPQVTSLPAPLSLASARHHIPFPSIHGEASACQEIYTLQIPASIFRDLLQLPFIYLLPPTRAPHTLLLPRPALLLPMCSSSPCFLPAVHSISSPSFSQHLLQASSLDDDKYHYLSLFKTLFFPPNN